MISRGSDGSDYDELYTEATPPPWEIGGPQPALASVLDGPLGGPKVLDLGCGTGDLALALARRGYDVTGVDVSRVAIDRARAKAAAAGLTVRFEVRDATDLVLPPAGALFDSGLLHNLHRRGGGRAEDYLALLPGLAAPGATVFVLAVSQWGLTEDFLRAGFAEPVWTAARVEAVEVAAEVDGEALALPGFLLSAVRGSRRRG